MHRSSLAPTDSGLPHSPLRFAPIKLRADPTRVVLRPFNISLDRSDGAGPSRAARLVADILRLDAAAAERELARVEQDFADRHWQMDRIFEARCDAIAAQMTLDITLLGTTRRRLIGAYFCQEYSHAAAAIMNPSMVAHPDQSGLIDGAQRFLMSVRTVGEGHISSIAFREGLIEADGGLRLWPEGGPAMAAVIAPPRTERADACVQIERQAGCNLSNCVIFPVTEAQRNGLEDLRLVRFVHDDGRAEYLGTYTAYSGRAIRSELLRTRDFQRFELIPLSGRAARDKGMALFPRMIDGRYMMIGREDGKNVTLLQSRSLTDWDSPGKRLLEPEYPWEFVQMGNCGSPIETAQGWILLTHGVGAMRKYCLGAVLLDRADPSRILARCAEPILTAAESDREGYVPNVVYSCGAMLVGDRLMIPYGIADSAVGFAHVKVADLLRFMR
ncbi:glycoside hydrolase family 130 protein [Sphingopyxis terrae]|uniref:Predicted glycosyl hydrolase, GH43/DUF377 family n=1 Tax=Sphingopyxis terrae subsp. ummariensis TaxID=429001 RepID=A0A1Y6FNF1_9SPHN|nr:glycoside hydrolase family 130 protein [Sphingopyxis terrae]PCF91340.1 glycosidase [Sphingopyxis terrae subsp. ummariensis]SMQ76514.1 Predicted glycosyl hydrolase, GH43/DUF377 family [Sphingopyxis terrae subsp. ummariensis]